MHKDAFNHTIEVLEEENEVLLVDDDVPEEIIKEIKPERHYKAIKSFDLSVTVITEQRAPKYKFDNSTLLISGLDNVSLKNLHLVQHNHDLFLYHGKTYYKIKLAHEYEVLEPIATPTQHNILQHASGKGITIEVRKTNTLQLEDSDEIKFHVLEVRDLLEENNTKYKFVGDELVINENLYNKLFGRFEIFYIEKTEQYYLRFKNQYYHLDHTSHEFTELRKELDPEILTHFKAQEDEKTIHYLQLEDIESMYYH